jgi:hypothetical protein
MWMLQFISNDFLLMFVNGILITGAILTFLSFFVINKILRWWPPLAGWLNLIQIISVVILLAGVYFKGSYQTEAEWRSRVTELEQKVTEAETKSQKTNTVIKTKVIEKVKKVKEYQIVYQDRIKEVEKLIDAECKVAPEALIILNDAARLRKGTVTVGPITPVEEKK